MKLYTQIFLMSIDVKATIFLKIDIEEGSYRNKVR
jgi:hypothetical protein